VLDRSSGVAGDVDCVATALTSPTPAPLNDSTTYEYAVPPVRSEIVAVVAVAPVPSYATIDGVTVPVMEDVGRSGTAVGATPHVPV